MTPLESLLDWLQRTYSAYFLPGEESTSETANEGDDTSEDEDDSDSTDEPAAESETPDPEPTPAPQTDGGAAADTRIAELQQEINDAQGHSSDNENKISRLERELEDTTERLETLEERSEQMLGMYDALAARINPFVDGEFTSIPHDSESTSEVNLTPEEESQPEEVEPDDEDNGETHDEDDEDEKSPMEEMFNDSVEEDESGEDEEVESQNTDTPTDELSEVMSNDEFFEEFERAHEFGLLEEIPDTERADDIVTRWLVDLLNEGGVERVRLALNKYKEVGWLGSKAHTQLSSRLKSRAQLKDEFNAIEGEEDSEDDDGEREGLSNETHERSYAYITLLTNC